MAEEASLSKEGVLAQVHEAARWSSRRILDNLGVTIPMAELPSWPAHCYFRRELYGGGWLSRLWCKRVRPWLMSRRQDEIRELYIYTRRLVQQEYLDAVLEKAKDVAKEMKR